jgi:hypothetical protein
MNKSSFFTGQPIFTQLLRFIPRSTVSSLARELKTDHYYKKFKSYDHLVTMLYTCFHGCKSLREVTTGMQVSFTQLNHLSMQNVPRRSTLSDANKRRNEAFFGKLYHRLYTYYFGHSPDSLNRKSIDERLFIIDSTTINLFSDVMKAMGMKPVSGKSKGGAKAHLLIKADEDVPRFVDLTDGTKNDKLFLKYLHLESGSIVVFDKGYTNYSQMAQWSKDNVTWVTRNRVNASYVIQGSNSVLANQERRGVLADETILMGRPSNKKTIKVAARKITYRHAESGRTFEFITNNMTLSALTIADIYKKRWQIENLFKRIKQSYPLKYFLGDNENAIKIQIWCSLITDLLVKIVQSKIRRKKWSYANLSSMIRLHLMSYVNIFKFLNDPDNALVGYQIQTSQSQLKLYT